MIVVVLLRMMLYLMRRNSMMVIMDELMKMLPMRSVVGMILLRMRASNQ